jgi:hypothetical protein
MLSKRAHPKTGEVAYQYIDWKPTDLPERKERGVLGSPLRSILVCRDRVEISTAWCFSSGMMEFYEDGTTEVVARSAANVAAEIERRFGSELALAVAALYANADAFAA